jgi:serine/threonine-protein kinase SRPK3
MINIASWKDKHLTECIQPPSLRAPEVFLGAPWDASVDVWGFACIVRFLEMLAEPTR